MAKKDPNAPTSPGQVSARQKEVTAIELRIGGASFTKIGDALGMTHEGARQAVLRGLERTRKELEAGADILREVERQRLEGMILSIASQAKRGHLGAVDQVRKLSESIRKLEGLDKDKGSTTNINLHLAEIIEKEADRIYAERTAAK